MADGSNGQSRESPGLQTRVVHHDGNSHVWLVAATLRGTDGGTAASLQRPEVRHCSRPAWSPTCLPPVICSRHAGFIRSGPGITRCDSGGGKGLREGDLSDSQSAAALVAWVGGTDSAFRKKAQHLPPDSGPFLCPSGPCLAPFSALLQHPFT